MSNTTSESEEKIVPPDCINSPTIDEVSTERNMVGSGPLKKGPWTSAEDAILVEYVNKHGEGNWNAVQKHSGLSRCGKSCRLRWANHLRPDLKKGAFTPEEERRIIELHSKMGNRWARMAVELPGRTDNEIKNFWNTRTKRRQRAGLPIYPPDVCLQAAVNNNSTHSQNMVTFPNEEASHGAEIFPSNNFDIPVVKFKKLELNPQQFPAGIMDIPGGSLLDLPHGLTSTCNNSFLFPMAHPPKRVRRSETYQSFELSCVNGSHAYLNGNTCSSSEPVYRATKLELPSFQHCTQPSSPLPSLESVDTLMGHTKSDRNSGLLEAVLYESRNLNMSKSNNNSSSSQNLRVGEWEGYLDPISPLGNSAASVFSEYTPHISGSSLDEHQSVETVLAKHEAEDCGGKQLDREDENPNHIDYSRPDFLLGSNWFGCGERLKDPIGALLGDYYLGKWDDISESR